MHNNSSKNKIRIAILILIVLIKYKILLMEEILHRLWSLNYCNS